MISVIKMIAVMFILPAINIGSNKYMCFFVKINNFIKIMGEKKLLSIFLVVR